jgi:hypothetical protein
MVLSRRLLEGRQILGRRLDDVLVLPPRRDSSRGAMVGPLASDPPPSWGYELPPLPSSVEYAATDYGP